LTKVYQTMSVSVEYPFSLAPTDGAKVKTRHRQIVTALPPPDALAVLEQLRRYEPLSMACEQLPVVWDRAEGSSVYDPYGNKWIDFSSGIFVANIGHGHPRVRAALNQLVNHPLLHSYYFPTDVRSRLVRKLVESGPRLFEKAFLLSTGSETTECAQKIARLRGTSFTPRKVAMIASSGAFHGKTMGAVQLGGKPAAKEWIGSSDPNIHHLPFPFPATCPYGEGSSHECSAECFDRGMSDLLTNGLDPETVAGFMLESYQGWAALFYPPDYVQAIAKWARSHDALLIFDEVQAGFGRTGKFFGFEHYGVIPDIVCCGKALSSSIPVSAVLGSAQLLDLDPSLNSTHSGNPLGCAAALATLEVLEEEHLVDRAAKLGPEVELRLQEIQSRHPSRVALVLGRGMVWALILRPSVGEGWDVEAGDRITEAAMRKGLLMIRTGSGSIKIGPPLSIDESALFEGIEVLGDAFDEVLS
jgi:4-aminobutyrate aminotransferase/(S)-3-amino-2-methylpropionate transaminase